MVIAPEVRRCYTAFHHHWFRGALLTLNRRYSPSKAWMLPVVVFFDVSNECNLDCFYCPRVVVKSRTGFMDIDEFTRLLARLGYNPPVVVLEGLGEPLMNPGICEMVALAAHGGSKAIITSNGTMLCGNRAAALASSGGLMQIRISVNSADPKRFAALKGGARLDVVMENVRQFVRLKNAYEKEATSVAFSVVGMKSNLAELPQIVDLAAEVGADTIILSDLSPMDRAAQKEMLWEKDVPLIRKAQRHARSRGISLTLTCLDRLRGKQRRCHAPWEWAFIDKEGHVCPCDHISRQQISFGNLNDISFSEIWHGEAYARFRSAHQDGRVGACNTCQSLGWRIADACMYWY